MRSAKKETKQNGSSVKMKREKSPDDNEKIESSGDGDGDVDVDGDTTMDPELAESSMTANAPPAKRKGGRKPIYATSEERKQRNRQAQAAFRERRTEYIKELERKLEVHGEQLRELGSKNRLVSEECLSLRYRNSLLERILSERGIDYKTEMSKIEMTIPTHNPQIMNNQAPRQQYPNRALAGPNGAPGRSNIQPAGMSFQSSISSPRMFSAQGGSHANSPATRTPMPIAANEPGRSNLSGPAQTAMYPQNMPPPTYGGMPDQNVPQQGSYMPNNGQWAPYNATAPQVNQDFNQEMYVGEHAQSSTPQSAAPVHNSQYDYRSRPIRPMAPMNNMNENQSAAPQGTQRALAPAPPYGAMPENDPFGLNTGGISYPPPFSYPDSSRRNQGDDNGH